MQSLPWKGQACRSRQSCRQPRSPGTSSSPSVEVSLEKENKVEWIQIGSSISTFWLFLADINSWHITDQECSISPFNMQVLRGRGEYLEKIYSFCEILKISQKGGGRRTVVPLCRPMGPNTGILNKNESKPPKIGNQYIVSVKMPNLEFWNLLCNNLGQFLKSLTVQTWTFLK